MRKFPLFIGLLACIPLAGCNWWPGHEPAPQRVVVTCHCAPPIRGATDVQQTHVARTEERGSYRSTQRTRHHRYRHVAHYSRHHDAHGSRRYIWHKREAEASVDTYGYSSSSQRYGSGAQGYAHGYGYSHGEGGYGYHGQHGMNGQFSGSTRVWADGYGRRHIYDQSAVRHYSYQAHVRQKQTPERLDPWHYYNEDWD